MQQSDSIKRLGAKKFVCTICGSVTQYAGFCLTCYKSRLRLVSEKKLANASLTKARITLQGGKQ